MRIGIILQYYDFRKDVRRLIDLLADENDVVLFVKPDELDRVPNDFEVRVVRERKRSFRNRMVNAAYALVGNLPGSRRKYYEWKLRNLDSYRNDEGLRGRLILELGVRLPDYIDFDRYAGLLDYAGETNLDDIDVFFSFTDVNDPYLAARLIQEGKRVVTYLYSWDHPGKYHRFSRSNIRYLVWNEALAQDLLVLHNVPLESTRVIGSTQFAFVQEYLDNSQQARERQFDFPYIYFGAAAGYLKVTEQEVRVMGAVARTLQSIDPQVRLVIRPYPLASNWDYYDRLRDHPNVVFDDYREVESADDPSSFVSKFSKITDAIAFVHIGSTLGLEASYLGTPVIHLDLTDTDVPDGASSLRRLIHTYHGERYMLLYDYPNVVKDQRQLEAVLRTALENPSTLLAYNNQIAGSTKLRSFEDLVEKIQSEMQEYAGVFEATEMTASD